MVTVALESLIALKISAGSDFIRTTFAVSIATSVPAPIAIPISAWAKAGASLTPSPTIATNFPSSCSFLTYFALSSGKTSANTLFMPRFLPIVSAVFLLSPVIIATSNPNSFICLTAFSAFSFMGSAAAATPATFPSIAKIMIVFPSERSLSISFCKGLTSMFLSFISFTVPTRTCLPSTFASTPCPARFLNPSIVVGIVSFLFFSSSKTAWLKG